MNWSVRLHRAFMNTLCNRTVVLKMTLSDVSNIRAYSIANMLRSHLLNRLRQLSICAFSSAVGISLITTSAVSAHIISDDTLGETLSLVMLSHLGESGNALILKDISVEISERQKNRYGIKGKVGLIHVISANAEVLEESAPNIEAIETLGTDIPEEEGAYSELIATIGADCVAPDVLGSETYISHSGQELRDYYCWFAPMTDSSKTGQWLGTVPTSEDAVFGATLTCRHTDTACQANLKWLMTDYDAAMHDAALFCGAKRGTLYLRPLDQQLDIRCWFLEITVSDLDGDGEFEYIDPVTADSSMFIADIAP